MLRPFAVGLRARRAAVPRRYSWADSLRNARNEAKTLRAENSDLLQRAIQSEFALQENVYLPTAPATTSTGRASPPTSTPKAAEVIGRPAGAYTQAIVIAAGSSDRVHVNDPVVSADGLVGSSRA